MKSVSRFAHLLLLLTTSLCPGLTAQTLMRVPEGITCSGISPEHVIIENCNNWLFSQNPSAIGVKTMPDIGTVQLAGSHLGGKLHRVMESNAANGWGFGAASYRSLSRLNLWGDFVFTQKRHIGRGWSDNFDPYNGNPFQAGSELRGGYTEQVFNFKVKLSSLRLFRRLWLGAGLDYAIGDLSRTQDPRSRVQFIDLNVTPGLILALGRSHKIGADFRYRYRKEKNNNYISKAQDSKEYLLYIQEGLGVYTTLYSSNFDRRVKGNYYGGEVQWEYAGNRFSLFATAGLLARSDRIEDRNRACPGDYANRLYEASIRAKWQTVGVMQLLTAKIANTTGTADKTFQETETVTDPGSGVTTSHYKTLFSAKAYTHYALQGGLQWTYYRLGTYGYRWYAGAGAEYLDTEWKYVFYVPSSRMKVSSLGISVRGGMVCFARKRHRIAAELTAGYLLNIDGSCFISGELEGQAVRRNITEPDYAILTADAVHAGASVKYIFPLSRKIDGFLTVWGQEYLSTSDKNLKRGAAGISVGILTDFRK